MARFACQGDTEPLMRLERPSTASSQTTAHIINACFNEILSSKQLDSKDISNLVVSKRESIESDSDFQEFYVDRLTKIADESKQYLDELAVVERHIVQARAKALADDEKNLAILVGSCPSYKDIGLPQGPSQFHNYLDEDLLSRHNLLVPSKYFPLQSTINSSNIQETTEKVQVFGKSKLSGVALASQKAFKPWQDSLSASDRHIEKQVMSELNRKTAFLKNPKYSTEVSNTSSFGSVKKTKKKVTGMSSSFLIQPKEVFFSVYHPGDILESVIEFKNISGASRQLRVIPVKSDYFSVSAGCFPTQEGVVAPGMKCSFVVTFTPDSLANYKYQMQVIVSNGECLLVPLIGMRPAPELSLPSVLNCGGCLVGDSKVWSTQCFNLGGEGKFKLMLPEENEEDGSNMDASSIQIGAFLVSPNKFSLSAEKGCIELQVTFTPPGVGSYTEQLNMACDNGQVLAYTLAGVAEKLCIGCTEVRPSSIEEKNSFSIEIKPSLPDTTSLTTSIHNYKEVKRADVINAPSVKLESVNPHDSSYKTVVYQNFSNVNLPFCWKYYQPITQSLGIEGEFISDTPCQSDDSPFFISPSSGTIPARQMIVFVVRFNPKEPGCFVDMGYLTLTRRVKDDALNCSTEGVEWKRLPDSKVSISCLQMHGICEPFRVEVSPPAIIIPGEIPFFNKVHKNFKMINHSISANVCYQWVSNEKSITVEPASGKIDSGSSCSCEVTVEGCTEGSFSSTLHCSLEGSCVTYPLHITGKIQGPVITLDCGYLDFGLIPFNGSSCLRLGLSNHSNSPAADYCCKQLLQERDNGFMDHPCITFIPDEGNIPPHSSCSIEVECKPQCSGRLKSIMQLLINGKHYKCVSIEAEVQRPELCLDSCQVHMEEVYVGISCIHTVVLKNFSLLPAHFTWHPQVFGRDRDYCMVDIKVTTGKLDPKEELTIPIDITWTTQGTYDSVYLKCDVIDMDSPLFVSLSANVKGLSVEYRLLSTENLNETVVPLSTDDDDKFLLEFGSSNELGRPVSVSLKVINNSAIPTTLHSVVSNFPAADVTRPGKNSNIIVKAGSISVEQEVDKYIGSLLSHGRGVCFVAEPSHAELPAFGSVTVKVTAYSNFWGEYRDQLTCDVAGLDKTNISISIGFVGCPVEFQPTATYGRTLVRFGTHLIGVDPIRRKIKMKNIGPVALRVDWRVLDLLSDDKKLINLMTIFGNPFPLSTCALNEGELCPSVGKPDRNKTTSSHLEEEKGDAEKSVVDGNSDKHPNGGIQVFLELHEGQETDNSPFSIHPKQMVIPARGHASVEVAYTPTSTALRTVGSDPFGYALGYISIDEQQPPNVFRKTCYEVEPLRIDLMAGIEHPKLILHCDEDKGLHFDCPASLLLQYGTKIASEAFDEHTFTLSNPTTSVQYIDVYTSSSYFFISDVQAPCQPSHGKDGMIAVKPHGQVRQVSIPLKQQSLSPKPQALRFQYVEQKICINCGFETFRLCNAKCSVKFTFGQSDIAQEQAVLNKRNKYECNFEGKLQINFSLGVVQEFGLTATIKLPILSVSEENCEFGIIHLGKSSVCSFIVSNVSVSKAVWTVETCPELVDVLTVNPQSGVLMPHLYQGKLSNQQINLIFTPKLEATYNGMVILREVLTNQTLSLCVSGKASADEQHSK